METLIKCTVVINKPNGEVVFKKTWETKNPKAAATKFSQMHPDCYVKLTYGTKKIDLLPKNMIKDQLLYGMGRMSLRDFNVKWYGKHVKLKAPKYSELKAEFESEFGEIV